jgi:hypothetical protein
MTASFTHGKTVGVDDPWKLRIVMYFDRETVALLRTTLDRAWNSPPPSEQVRTSRSVLAERILRAAAQGERDPDRLVARSVTYHRDARRLAS